MKAAEFKLKRLSAALLGVFASTAAMGSSLTLQSNYLYTGTNDYGTLGYYRNTSPGIQHDPTGSRTFASTKDYFTPGAPFEGFTVYDGGGVVVNNNNTDLGGSAAATTNAATASLAGTVSDKSGVAFLGVTADHRAYWADAGTNAKVSITNDVSFSATDQAIKIKTTITAKQNLAGLKFVRQIDPDQDSPSSVPGGSSATYNSRGATDVAATDIVCGKGWIRELRICMYTRDTTTHNTGVSSGWTRDPSFYLAGTAQGDGDYVLGLAFDIGTLNAGESITLEYYYLFAEDLSVLAALISNAGGANSRFVDLAKEKGLGTLAQVIANNSTAFSSLITNLETLDAASLATALKKIFATEHTTPTRTVLASSASVSSLVFDKAGTFLGDFSSVRSSSYRQNSQETALTEFTGDETFRDIARKLTESPIDFRPNRLDKADVNAFSPAPYAKFTPHTMGAWVQGFYDYGQGRGSDANLGYKNETYGLITAVERTLSEDVLLGVMFSHQEGTTTLDDFGGWTDSSTNQVGVYLQRLLNDVKLTGSVGLGTTRYEGARNIAAASINETAISSYDGRLYSTTVGASRLYKWDPWQVEPFAQLSYTHSKTDGYEEAGAGVYNLSVGESTNEYAALKAGSVFKYELNGGYVKVKPSVSFQDEIRASQNNVAFVSGTETVLVNGREIDSVTGGIGLEGAVNLKNGARFQGGIDYSTGSDYHATQLYLRYEKIF